MDWLFIYIYIADEEIGNEELRMFACEWCLEEGLLILSWVTL